MQCGLWEEEEVSAERCGRRLETTGAQLCGEQKSHGREKDSLCVQLTVSFSGTLQDPRVLSSLRTGTTRLTPAL